MSTNSGRKVFSGWVLALGASASLLVTELHATSSGRIVRPRLVSFLSTARGAELDLEALATDNLRPSERAFLREAIEMSRTELRLAQVASSQATRSDLRSFSQQVVSDYRQITESLDGLVRKKGAAIALSTDMATDRFDPIGEKSGAEFDREFVRATAKAQDEMVKLFERALSDAKDADVRELAGSYLPALRAHQTTVRDLKKAFE